MSEPFIGEIRLVAFTYPPKGWMLCDGSILSIAQNTALFSLLGTTYGGNGTTTFAVPDFRGRFAVKAGQGPGLSNYALGQQSGTESVTLTSNQLPLHPHQFLASGAEPTTDDPSTARFAALTTTKDTNLYDGAAANAQAASDMIGISGGGAAHENRMPNLCLMYVIATVGIFPSRS